MPGLKVLSVRITTKQIEDQAVTTAKLANSAVTNAKLADPAVTSPKIADGEVKAPDVSPEVIQFGKDAIDSVETWVEFPTEFPGTPEVVAVGIDVDNVRVVDVTSGSFKWVAEASGSARWIAVYRG